MKIVLALVGLVVLGAIGFFGGKAMAPVTPATSISRPTTRATTREVKGLERMTKAKNDDIIAKNEEVQQNYGLIGGAGGGVVGLLAGFLIGNAAGKKKNA